MYSIDFLDKLLSDVIKPLHRQNFEFIFHPGDTTKMHAFEVEEMLDIISDYSSYGRVTLILDENEAGNLLNQLNIPEGNYLCLFNTMRIDMLLIVNKQEMEKALISFPNCNTHEKFPATDQPLYCNHLLSPG